MQTETTVPALDAAIYDAQDAFWEVIAERFPQVRYGDLDMEAQSLFDDACREVVQAWLDNNDPQAEP